MHLISDCMGFYKTYYIFIISTIIPFTKLFFYCRFRQLDQVFFGQRVTLIGYDLKAFFTFFPEKIIPSF
ncbi:hypothetical protein PDENDC454_24143, partial [Paenibacillus dendritiformis C454]